MQSDRKVSEFWGADRSITESVSTFFGTRIVRYLIGTTSVEYTTREEESCVKRQDSGPGKRTFCVEGRLGRRTGGVEDRVREKDRW